MFAELTNHNTFIVQSVVIYKIIYILWNRDLVFKRHIFSKFWHII